MAPCVVNWWTSCVVVYVYSMCMCVYVFWIDLQADRVNVVQNNEESFDFTGAPPMQSSRQGTCSFRKIIFVYVFLVCESPCYSFDHSNVASCTWYFKVVHWPILYLAWHLPLFARLLPHWLSKALFSGNGQRWEMTTAAKKLWDLSISNHVKGKSNQH